MSAHHRRYWRIEKIYRGVVWIVANSLSRDLFTSWFLLWFGYTPHWSFILGLGSSCCPYCWLLQVLQLTLEKLSKVWLCLIENRVLLLSHTFVDLCVRGYFYMFFFHMHHHIIASLRHYIITLWHHYIIALCIIASYLKDIDIMVGRVWWYLW